VKVVVLGGGSTGEHFVGALRRLDAEVEITLVERRLVGGECSYWACMPTKAMLRPTEVVASARLAPGAAEAITGEIDAQRVFWHRDQTTNNRDDSSQERWLESQRAALVRGEGVVARPGVVAVAGRELKYDVLVISTGSSPAVPPIEGLDEVDYWTNREATETTEVPESVVVLGGGPVGCELSQFFARVGSRVTLLQGADRLLPRSDAVAGELLEKAFAADGIDVRLGAQAERVEPGVRVSLAGGDAVEGERLIVATGRRANVDGFGFEELLLEISRRGIEVDDRLAAAEGIWAIGDVTGIAQFTHVGKYQARVAAANVAGRDARADYRAIPASIFTDPQVASVGRMDGDGVVTTTWSLANVPRTYTYERPVQDGVLKVAASKEQGVLVGALGIGPESGEWVQQLTLAIRAEVPIDLLLDTIQPYPTFSEAVFFAVRELADQL
jgi:pyruvate/2-oxoglutarate dehydrogenase complex dihydrolipoamide dehydrogenase (E3) component